MIKCLTGEIKRFLDLSTYYKFDSSTITPFGGQEESRCSNDGNCKELLCPCILPAGHTSCTAVYNSSSSASYQWRHRLNQMHDHSMFLAQNMFIRKLMSWKTLSILLMAIATKFTNSLSLVFFQISRQKLNLSS